MNECLLIGNTFPTSLMRVSGIRIDELPIVAFKELAKDREIYSYWGHANSRLDAERCLGVDLNPRSERPSVVLDKRGRPCLYGMSFDTCYVLSPDMVTHNRPAIGAEVSANEIVGWHLLKISWPDAEE